ncbi:hypothetical protein, partial [Nocardiopsis alba]|uniref:hypothetical protein n=1 Tax=Nocardiopsis alba TaxID=53437 RepID=UPI0033E0A13F
MWKGPFGGIVGRAGSGRSRGAESHGAAAGRSPYRVSAPGPVFHRSDRPARGRLRRDRLRLEEDYGDDLLKLMFVCCHPV